MRKTLPTMAAVLVSAAIAFGQEEEPKYLVWEADSAHSDSFYRDGLLMLLVEHEDVEVGTTIQRYTWRLWTDSYLVNVVIRNNSDRRLDVNPQEIRLVDREKLRYVQHQNIDEMVEDQAKFDTISENAADHILSEVLLRTTLFPDE